MQIGPYTVSSVECGSIWLDGGAMHGTVPRVLWEKKNPPDDKNRIKLAMRALLLEGEGKKIMVDCGVGEKGGDRFREMFNVDLESANIEKSLKEKGLSRDDITDVILTHLHFDHAGGATLPTGNGNYTASFPNATYYLQRRNLEIAQKPNPRERASYLKEIYEALIQERRLHLLDGPKSPFPNIDLWISFGHTEAQQHVKVWDETTTLFYCADIIPMSAHVTLPWIMGYDLHPLVMLEEKKKILEPAVQENWILFFEHDPAISACRVVEGKRGSAPGETVSI